MIHKSVGTIKVPAIGQGTQGIKDPEIIRRGIDLGMTFIDTAEIYGNEEIIGQSIKGIRDKVFISDKFSPEHSCYADVIKACETSLSKLGTDYIDLYSVHWPNPAIPIEQTRDALLQLQKQGKIRHIGVCNSGPDSLGNLEPGVIQAEYNLLDRSIESDILPYCDANNILTVAYSPLECLYHLPSDRMLWLEEIAFIHQKTLAQIALNWLISHRTVIVIPKTKDPQHQLQNATASDFALSIPELKRIDDLFICKAAFIEPALIRVSKVGKFPQTIDEAKANIMKFCPSPIELAASLRDTIKPVKVEPRKTGFELIEGGLRYWAWVIRYGDRPIPAIVVGEMEERYAPTPEPKCQVHPGSKWFEVEKMRFCGQCYKAFLDKAIGHIER